MNAKAALNIDGLEPRDELQKHQHAITKLTTNVGQFPSPNPTLAVAQADHDAAKDVLDEIDQVEGQLITLREQRDQKMGISRGNYRMHASFVENKAGGDPAKIADGGFDVAQPPGTPQPMIKVQNNVLTAGDDEGSADGAWNRIKGAKSYEYQTAATAAGPYVHEATVTVSKHSMTGKSSGQKLWSRVRAINKLGPGAWSDPACCTVP